MPGHLDKSFLVVVVGGGDIAIIASSSRSRSDFEKDHEVEIFRDLEIWTWTQPGPELDNINSPLIVLQYYI